MSYASAACALRPTCPMTASGRRSATPPGPVPFTLIAGGEDIEAGAVSLPACVTVRSITALLVTARSS